MSEEKTSERNGRSYLLRDEAVREEKRKPLENCVSAVEAENLREEKNKPLASCSLAWLTETILEDSIL